VHLVRLVRALEYQTSYATSLHAPPTTTSLQAATATQRVLFFQSIASRQGDTVRACAITGDGLRSRGDRIGAVHVGTLGSRSLLLLVIWLLSSGRPLDDGASSHASIPLFIEPRLAVRNLEVIGGTGRCNMCIRQGIREGLVLNGHAVRWMREITARKWSLMCSTSCREASSIEGAWVVVIIGVVGSSSSGSGSRERSLGRRHDALTTTNYCLPKRSSRIG
jgi:hypothetical protein